MTDEKFPGLKLRETSLYRLLIDKDIKIARALELLNSVGIVAGPCRDCSHYPEFCEICKILKEAIKILEEE